METSSLLDLLNTSRFESLPLMVALSPKLIGEVHAGNQTFTLPPSCNNFTTKTCPMDGCKVITVDDKTYVYCKLLKRWIDVT